MKYIKEQWDVYDEVVELLTYDEDWAYWAGNYKTIVRNTLSKALEIIRADKEQKQKLLGADNYWHQLAKKNKKNKQ